MTSDDPAPVDLLESVLTKTGGLIAGVQPEQSTNPTPCPGYDVSGLVDHLVGWVQVFAAGVAGQEPSVDPGEFRAGERPAEEFGVAAGQVVTAFRGGALDRSVSLGQGGGGLPGSAVVGMMLMEYVGHGWDLATATGQPLPFTDGEAEAALAAGRQMLQPQYRGPDKPFGHEVPVRPEASSVERLIGFLGREPQRT